MKSLGTEIRAGKAGPCNNAENAGKEDAPPDLFSPCKIKLMRRHLIIMTVAPGCPAPGGKFLRVIPFESRAPFHWFWPLGFPKTFVCWFLYGRGKARLISIPRRLGRRATRHDGRAADHVMITATCR